MRILVIGRNDEIPDIVVRLINKTEGWHATGARTDEEAIEIFRNNSFDLVLLGGGIDESSEAYLRAEVEKIRPGTNIVQHYGGGSGLLMGEILDAIKK